VLFRSRPTTDRGLIETRARRIGDAMAVLDAGGAFGVEPFEDPADLLARAAIEDAALAPADLQTVATILRNARDLQKTFHGAREAAPSLWKLAADLAPEPALLKAIEEAIEPDGTVADRASPDLARIRRAMHDVQERVRLRLEKMVRQADLKPFLTGDYVTLRSGRYVIPVQAVQAGEIPGIIHDRSDSGATVFVEPQQIVALGNELRSLAADEQREVQRILRALTARVRAHLEPLRETVAALVEFDLVRACAVYGRERQMTPAAFSEDGALVIARISPLAPLVIITAPLPVLG
jgi:DNA mismatch repair protein MutS2